ncbi:MAG TPA: DNA topoisomerase IV subunit A [Rectinemataceae bacterium]
MAYVKKLFNDNFLYYASYVIKDRAIPDLEDGLKPVQRRILHSLFEMDDGKFHKVANVIGHCMKYHPHGDQSIGSALVVLANKELFIDKQGNFGNILTGDDASAARYIECKASAFAKDVFYNPKITAYADSYDGRNKEPVLFPAKLPVVLLTGAEGIAVGMSTKILPHNPLEVIEAEIACLRGKEFLVQPDFPTGGSIDLTEYRDGNGKVRVRAKLDTSDPKKIVIREIPFSSTTESLIASLEAAARSGQLKIASISDFTTDKVEIEIKLQRGVYTDEVVDALYAFTECEQSISCNCLVIKDEKPVVMTVSEIIKHHASVLLGILERELEIERGELLDEIHARTLERIFIEERVYKGIESKRSQEAVYTAVFDGLGPFAAEIGRAVTKEDVERLLKIPIRRISLWDIEKAKEELKRLNAALEEVGKKLANLTAYAIEVLTSFRKRLESAWARKTKVESFSKIAVKEAARRDLALRYDEQSGYIGTSVSSGEKILEVSAFDRILLVRRNGMYSVVPVPEKLFVDKGLLWVTPAVKEEVSSTLLTVVYKAADTGFPHIKRCRIEAWILEKDYSLIPEGAQLLLFSTEREFEFTLHYAPKPRTKKTEEVFKTKPYGEKGLKASGVRLANREVLSASSPAKRTAPVGPSAPELEPAPARARPQPAETKPSIKPSAKPVEKPEKKPAAGSAEQTFLLPSSTPPAPEPKGEEIQPELFPEEKGKGLLALARKKAGSGEEGGKR